MNKSHAIIIPYRDRAHHLKILLESLSCYQNKIDIFIMEQNNTNLFNRGALFNAYMLQPIRHKYLIFHDVDLIPDPSINYLIDYNVPTHLSCYCSQFNYKLLDNPTDYKESNMFGGVVAMSLSDFKKIKGYSNKFENWGCEDNNLMTRIQYTLNGYYRLPYRYESLQHEHLDIQNPNLVNNLILNDKLNNEYKKQYNRMKKEHYSDDNIKRCIPDYFDGYYDLIDSKPDFTISHEKNIYHMKIDIRPNKHNIVVLYKDLLNKPDLDYCLLDALLEKRDVILTTSEYEIDQAILNYYDNHKTSLFINDDTLFIKHQNLIMYILNKKTNFRRENLSYPIKKFDKFDYENFTFSSINIYKPIIQKSSREKFNHYLYKILNTDIRESKMEDEKSLFNHYKTQGIKENRQISLNLPLDFDYLNYVMMNKDLFFKSSIKESFNHYKTQGINENRKYIPESQYNIHNIDWSYFSHNITNNFNNSFNKYHPLIDIRNILNNSFNEKQLHIQLPLLNYKFDDVSLNKNKSDKILIVSHHGGGGVEKYLNMLIKFFPNNLILKPNCDKKTLYQVDGYYYHENNIDKLYEHICNYNIVKIIINHTYNYVPQVLQMIENIQSLFNCSMTCILHDLTFLKDNHYKSNLYYESRERLLNKSNVVISPSQYITNQYRHIIPITTVVHPDITFTKPHIVINMINNNFKILVFGHNKGKKEIHNLLNNTSDNIKVSYLGYIDSSHEKLKVIENHYDDNKLLLLIRKHNPHLIWFPSKKPESYCYAMSYAIVSGYPIACYNIGAFTERLKFRHMTWLLNIKENLHERLESIKESYKINVLYQNIKITNVSEDEYISQL